MKYIILCGGRGERFISSHPKPLNRACGRMIGEWMIHSLLKYNISELIWILNPKLYAYNIEDEIIRWTNGTQRANSQDKIRNIFIKLPFETRDPSETLEISLQQLDFDDSFICLDNDNIYVDGLDMFDMFDSFINAEAAILVSMMKPGITYLPQYGFVQVENNIIVAGKEKKMGWGENAYSCGGYAFKSLSLCRKWLFQQRQDVENDGQIKMPGSDKVTLGERSLLTLIIKYSQKTLAVITNDSFSIGTPQDCAKAMLAKNKYFGWKNTRIVVDLDNTLVTYPKEGGDYSTVQAQDNIVDWIRDKSEKGAEIIVSTARRMKTHQGNVGCVTADVGLTTLNTIKNLNINEKEINLGKPLGDIYLDDRAINPFDHNWTILSGDWSDIATQNPINSLPVTRDVAIYVKPVEHIIKAGSNNELRGQAEFYTFLSETKSGRSIRDLFPKCYEICHNESDRSITLDLEYIKGVPASYLWCHGVWGEREWKLCIKSLRRIHSLETISDVTANDIMKGYIDKVEKRRLQYANFQEFDPDGYLWNILKSRIIEYIPSKITHIHGDSFMGNIIFPMKGGIKFIDMKGELNGKITIHGDPNYDWAKLATSFLGMDTIVYKLPDRSITEGIHWIQRLDNYEIIISLALILIYGAIWVYNKEIVKNLIDRIFQILQHIRCQ